MKNRKRGLTLAEIMIAIVIFLIFLIPIWNLYIQSYGNIQVSKDEMITNVVSACLVSEFSAKPYATLLELGKQHPNGVKQQKIYGTQVDVEVLFNHQAAATDLYEYVEVKIHLSQQVLKPKPQLLEYKYSVVVPRYF